MGSVTRELAQRKMRIQNYDGPKLVSFVGEIGSGKSTAAKYLVEDWGFTYVRFAGPLKDMLKAIGLTRAQVDDDQKEVPCEMLGGLTPRFAMQTLGTEWGRDCMGQDFWMSLWAARARGILNAGGRVVVDDCRFENEDAAIRRLGGIHIRLHRRDANARQDSKESLCRKALSYFLRWPQPTSHVSEAYKVIENGGSIHNLGPKEDLYVGIKALLVLADK